MSNSDEQIVASGGDLDLSIVIPAYNESGNVEPLYKEIRAAFAEKSYEVIFVDDGSTDDTFAKLTELHEKYPEVRAISFKRNFKKSAAYSAGFAHARGRIVVTMDGDMQDDPQDVQKLLDKMDEGYDVIAGWKHEGKGAFDRRVPSRIFNAVVSRLTGIDLHDFNCPLKAYRREVLENICVYGEMHRFIPVLADRKGYKIGQVKVANRPRGTGETKYGIERLWRGMLDSITVLLINRYSEKPLHLFGSAGLILLTLGGLIHVFVILEKAFMGIPFKNSMGLITLGLIILTLAFNLFSVGLIMEYVLSRSIKPSDQYTIAEIL
jgi:glycosyltransferase involved in cell wall biosynthesis